MAKIKSVTLSFPASDSPDVVGYKLYYALEGMGLNYDSPFINLGNVIEVNLGGFPDLAGLDGVYDLGVVAIDDAGNESDMSMAVSVPLDFSAPAAPVDVVVTRS